MLTILLRPQYAKYNMSPFVADVLWVGYVNTYN